MLRANILAFSLCHRIRASAHGLARRSRSATSAQLQHRNALVSAFPPFLRCRHALQVFPKTFDAGVCDSPHLLLLAQSLRCRSYFPFRFAALRSLKVGTFRLPCERFPHVLAIATATELLRLFRVLLLFYVFRKFKVIPPPATSHSPYPLAIHYPALATSRFPLMAAFLVHLSRRHALLKVFVLRAQRDMQLAVGRLRNRHPVS